MLQRAVKQCGQDGEGDAPPVVRHSEAGIAFIRTGGDEDVSGGLAVDGGILWCATEVVSKEEIDRAVAIIKEVC